MAVFGLAQLAALFLIALSAARGTLSPGMVVASSLLFELVVWPVLGLSSQWSQMQASVGAFGRISAWLKLAENKKTDASNTKHEELAQGICNRDQGNTQKGAHKENEIAMLRLQQVTVIDEDSGRTFWIRLRLIWFLVNWLR